MTLRTFCVLSLTLLSSCDLGRTPSKERLEKVCKVKLPKDCKVIKDDYQDMGQDYCIIYDLQLTDSSTSEFVNSIKTSLYYNPNVSYNGIFLNQCRLVNG